MSVIQPIVEGHGEGAAVRVLLNRLMECAGRYDFQIAQPIRRTSSDLLRPDGIAKAVALARTTDHLRGILILFDGDLDLERGGDVYTEFCPKLDTPPLTQAAQTAAAGTPCEIVVAFREYESWLLAGMEGLVAAGRVQQNALCPTNLDTIRGAKGALKRVMQNGFYHETTHQASLTSCFDLGHAYRRSRSFRRLTKAFGTLHAANGNPLVNWPPPAWLV